MAQTGTPNTSSLFRPLGASGVLIRGEKIRYNERKHWAVLIRPFVETLLVLSFITGFARELPIDTLGLVLAVGAVLMFFYEWRRHEWNRGAVYAIVAALVIGWALFGRANLAIIAILITAGRFVYRSAMWAFYERLYITNRRIMFASGFLGAEISTMPLTRVTDIKYETTVMGEVLGYGQLHVETAGQDQALSLIEFLDDPSRFYELLIDLSTAAVGSVTTDDEEPPQHPPDPEDEGAGSRDHP